ncbi:MAG: hypothetical protein ACYS0C_09375 [Planctomycetota bacterium]|jgi:hypothetical protein
MRVIRKFELLSFLFVAVLFVANASAGPVEFLPDSSHYQGRTYYSTNTDEANIFTPIRYSLIRPVLPLLNILPYWKLVKMLLMLATTLVRRMMATEG